MVQLFSSTTLVGNYPQYVNVKDGSMNAVMMKEALQFAGIWVWDPKSS